MSAYETLRVDAEAGVALLTIDRQEKRNALSSTVRAELVAALDELRGDDAVRVPVRFGLAGDDTIEIADGLREGEEVVISDMSEYADVANVRLKGTKRP